MPLHILAEIVPLSLFPSSSSDLPHLLAESASGLGLREWMKSSGWDRQGQYPEPAHLSTGWAWAAGLLTHRLVSWCNLLSGVQMSPSELLCPSVPVVSVYDKEQYTASSQTRMASFKAEASLQHQRYTQRVMIYSLHANPWTVNSVVKPSIRQLWHDFSLLQTLIQSFWDMIKSHYFQISCNFHYMLHVGQKNPKPSDSQQRVICF